MNREQAPQGDSRDAGLWRLSRLRRGIAVTGLALVGGFSAFVAQAKPGKSSGSAAPSAPSTSTASGGGSSSASSGGNFAQEPLRAQSGSSGSTSSDPAPTVAPPAQAPTQAPAPAPVPAAPAVVSGGS